VETCKLVDLHFHSVHSDGSETVSSIIEEAERRGVCALALTDHNNGNGVSEFVAGCQKQGIEYLEGVEIYGSFAEHEWSWDYQFCGPVPDLTILGRELDWGVFRAYQKMLVKYWANYWIPETLKKIEGAGLRVPKLNKDQIWDQVKDFGTPSVFHDVPKNPENWPALIELVQSFDSAVTEEEIRQKPVRWANRHLYAIGKPAYVLRAPQEWTIESAVQLAEDMEGALFIAHPGGEYGNWSERHLEFAVEQGVHGIEVYQYFHSPDQIKRFKSFALRHDLLVSGGSDYHGTNGKPTLGCWNKEESQTPWEVFKQLQEMLPW